MTPERIAALTEVVPAGLESAQQALAEEVGSGQDSLRSVQEVAKLFGVCDKTVRRHVNSSDLAEYWPHHRIGRQIRFTGADIEAILARTQHQPPPGRPAIMNDAKILRGLQRLDRARAQQVGPKRADRVIVQQVGGDA